MKPLIPQDLRQNNFDILRFILASAVIFCHCYVIYYGYDRFVETEPFMKWSNGKMSIGTFAVNFFFVISGFLIIKSFETSTDFWDYLKKRVLRIYPGFLVVFALGIFVFAPLGHLDQFNLTAYFNYFSILQKKRELSNMFSLQPPIEENYFSFLPIHGLNSPLWTIQYEFICYLLVPILGIIGILRKKTFVLATFLISYIWFVLQHYGLVFHYDATLNGGFISNPFFYPRFFTYFLGGAVIYLYRDKIPSYGWIAFTCLVLIIFSFRLEMIDVVLPWAGSYLLFFISYQSKLQYPAFSKYGDFSYGIYLYGWPIQQLMMLYAWPYLGPKRFFIFVFPLVLVFAILSWKFIESPALKLKNHKLNLAPKLIPIRKVVKK